MNIAEIAAAYLSDKRRTRRESTVEGYESALRLHVLPRWGGIDIAEIDPDDMQAWVLSFDKPGAAEKAYKTLRQVIRWAIRKYRLRVYDPTTAGIELPRKAAYHPQVLDAAQAREYLRGLWGCEAEAAALCSLTLGLLRGESCALTWGGRRPAHGGGAHKQVAPGRALGHRRRAAQDVPERPLAMASRLRPAPPAPARERAQQTRSDLPSPALLSRPPHQVLVQVARPAARVDDQPAAHVGDARHRGRHRHRDRGDDAKVKLIWAKTTFPTLFAVHDVISISDQISVTISETSIWDMETPKG